jgi:hypothetical protein
MFRFHRAGALFFLVGVLTYAVLPLRADEGMWTFDNPPRQQLKELYGFEPTQQWLEHVRLSSVRFNDGGSGAFVSANGLVLTNHHVARGQLQKMSSASKDYAADGFLAKSMADEMPCPDLELNVLVSMEDVTQRVMAALKPGMLPKEAVDARKAVSALISKESKEKTGLRSDVIGFYQGSEYWLYRYKKYTDVRLVMAPEVRIAFYGGDADNFTYPRHDLDMTFFRVYENNKPLKTEHFLRWKTAGAVDGELVFVSGHPGSTNRLQTLAQTEYQRDHSYPLQLKSYARRLALLKEYAKRGPEQARQAAGQIFGIENSLKAQSGEYAGLLDKNLQAKKAAEEQDFRMRVEGNPQWKSKYGGAWDSISAAVERSRSISVVKTHCSVKGRLFGFAQTLAQYAKESVKPNGERLAAYQDANLESTKFRLFSRAPLYPELEELQIADGLAETLEKLGPDHPFVKVVLNGRAAGDVSRELVKGTQLGDPTVRKKLFEGGAKSIAGSNDPMIVLARGVYPVLEEIRMRDEKEVSGVIASAGEKLGEARFAVYGKSRYPDATFTLRLSYGTVKGYPMNGTNAPSKTTMFGLFDRAYSFDHTGDYGLPARFMERKEKLDLSTPMNFVSTCDIIGGNSGSPVINRNGEYVGLVFDGNIESLPGRFLYSEETNRCVSVHAAAMMECLRKLYDAGTLADELEGGAMSEARSQ